ncbi:MAG: thioredoxin-disulfide reductase [Patescibacteria group bacterium]
MPEQYDLIIIGGGPAGLTAGIYASRRNLKTLIITKNIGGQASSASWVENYPGFDKVNGYELMQKFQKQAESFGSEFKYEEIAKVEKKNKHFLVKTVTGNEFESISVILTFGKTPSNLNVPGEKEFTGKGVAYCATCDGPLFKNKIVAVIGGGNSALESADYMSKIAQKVFLIHRREEFRGEAILIDRIKKDPNIELKLNKTVAEIKGDKFVQSIILEDAKTKAKEELKLDGIFVEIGYSVDASAIKDLVKTNEKNEIIIDEACQTSLEGVFAAGDVTDIKFKQIVISAAEGAKAALTAYKYIQDIKGTKEAIFDWGKK